jgi:hypothetical protein
VIVFSDLRGIMLKLAETVFAAKSIKDILSQISVKSDARKLYNFNSNNNVLFFSLKNLQNI